RDRRRGRHERASPPAAGAAGAAQGSARPVAGWSGRGAAQDARDARFPQGHDRPQHARTARGRGAGGGRRAALRPLDRGREVPLAGPHERRQAERRGVVSTVTQVQELHREKLRRELGPDVLRWLEDPNVIEIMANPDGRVWLDTLTEGLVDTGLVL